MKIKSFIKFLLSRDYRFILFSAKGMSVNIPSKDFISKMYKIKIGKKLNLAKPHTYTEKLQWLKLYDQRPEYTIMVDKCAAKEYVASKIGEQYIIPTIGIWNSPDEIDFSSLPEKFVIKCNHNSGLGMYICHDKNKMNISKVKRDLKKGMAQDYYLTGREWPYKNVKRRIIAEKYMEDSTYKELRDYKFFTFNGVPKILYITQGRGADGATVADFFDMDFNHLPLTIDHDMAETPPDKPECFDEMKRLAAILSEGTPQLRVDFYEVDRKVYFGEMTFFHCSGFEAFHPNEWDKIFGEWVTLPAKRTEK
ncbi:MAG: glycosyl transferase [Ruminococcus sp.]|nr:glycosyl transferase [Ruminococcus sp.]